MTPWTAVCHTSLSITNSRSLLTSMSIESVMSSNHLILCHLLLLLPSIFPSIRIFSNESVLHIRWPKYWSFSFSSSPSNDYSRLISFRLEGDLFCTHSKEIQPVHPKGDQSWVFIGGTDVEAETPMLWPPDVKSCLI